MPTSYATQTRLNMPRHPIFCQRQSGLWSRRRLNLHTDRSDKTVLLCRLGQCELDNYCSERVHTSHFRGDSHESSKIQFTTRRDKTILWSRVRRCELGVRFNVPLDIKWVISGKAVTRVVFWVFEHRHPKFQMKI